MMMPPEPPLALLPPPLPPLPEPPFEEPPKLLLATSDESSEQLAESATKNETVSPTHQRVSAICRVYVTSHEMRERAPRNSGLPTFVTPPWRQLARDHPRPRIASYRGSWDP